jgi:hypothetical protein
MRGRGYPRHRGRAHDDAIPLPRQGCPCEAPRDGAAGARMQGRMRAELAFRAVTTKPPTIPGFGGGFDLRSWPLRREDGTPRDLLSVVRPKARPRRRRRGGNRHACGRAALPPSIRTGSRCAMPPCAWWGEKELKLRAEGLRGVGAFEGGQRSERRGGRSEE